MTFKVKNPKLKEKQTFIVELKDFVSKMAYKIKQAKEKKSKLGNVTFTFASEKDEAKFMETFGKTVKHYDIKE